MKRSPLYVFNDQAALGIYEVPLESIVHVIDSDGIGTPSVTQLIDKNLLFGTSTIAQYLNTTTAYKKLDRYTEYLNDLKDVTLPLVLNAGDVLRFDGTNWISASTADFANDIRLGDLAGVTPATPADDGTYLEWDEANKQFIYVKPAKQVEDLADVDAPNPVADQILNWDAVSNKWVAVNLDGGGF